MTTLMDIVRQSKGFKAFAQDYTAYVARLLGALDVDALERIAHALAQARRQGNTLFVIGNGGSAATAAHLANDFAFGSRESAATALKVVSLADNLAVLTATANDLGYAEIFVRPLQVYFRPGDKLMVISASGNSPNLVAAAQWVKAQGGEVFGFLGFDGGKLKGLCDASVVVATPKGEYGPVEDIHMVLDHLLAVWFHQVNRA